MEQVSALYETAEIQGQGKVEAGKSPRLSSGWRAGESHRAGQGVCHGLRRAKKKMSLYNNA
jgi:hypothetical protein